MSQKEVVGQRYNICSPLDRWTEIPSGPIFASFPSQQTASKLVYLLLSHSGRQGRNYCGFHNRWGIAALTFSAEVLPVQLHQRGCRVSLGAGVERGGLGIGIPDEIGDGLLPGPQNHIAPRPILVG